MQTAYIANGDVTAAAKLAGSETDTSRYFLTDVEVAAAADARTVVVIGDSITDGVGSTLDRNRRWPDALAERLQADPALASIAVVNSGIAGNRLLNDASKPFVGPSMLSRFERDALSKPGVRWILLLSGSNDISAVGHARYAERQGIGATNHRGHAAAHRACALCRHQGLRRDLVTVGGGRETIRSHSGRSSQAQGSKCVDPQFRCVRCGRRLRASSWATPRVRITLRRRIDSGDHLHPNEAGFAAMAAAIDLRMLR